MSDESQKPTETPENTESDEPSYIVGIGASAGGLEALQTFFKHLDPSAGLAYVVVQHLSPDYKSLMVELIAKITTIPVHRAQDGMRVAANNIYLIPPKKNLRIFHGSLILSEQERSPATINLPIDIFLTALAEDQESKAVAVILSGAGSDGTKGCRAVKEAGGMVMVQDETTAKFDAMPKSVIASGLPDFILAPEDMPAQLTAYTKHPYTVREAGQRILIDDKSGVTRIFSILRERTKIDFTFYKPNTIVRRIERRLKVTQIDNVADYIRYLESSPKEQTTLYRELLIGVTNFFRDPSVFSLLREQWLVDLLRRYQDTEFRVWVPGCSTGEEAYSYAILCHQLCEENGFKPNIKIFATDIDQEAIAAASASVFPLSIITDMDSGVLGKYFVKQGDSYRIIRQIREMVVFARHNLIKDPPFTNINLVSCRNLLIYLQPVLQNRVLEAMNFSLRPGGLLVLGTSESLGEAESLFEPLSSRWKIFRSRGKRKPLVPSSFVPNRGPYSFGDGQPAREGAPTHQIFDEDRVLGRFIDAVAEEYVPFTILVSETNEVLHIIGDGKNYIDRLSGKFVNDITRIVSKELAIPLSTGLAKVFSTQTEVSFTNVRIGTGREEERVAVNVRIRILPEQRGKDQMAAIMITETGRYPAPKVKAESESYDVSKEAEQRIEDLEQELQFTRENLQASIEELETSNEELQATNEELLASNEELQSTNEELQSVNEELFTVNAEYQNKISELSQLTNDLDNFVNSAEVILIFLDEDLDLRRFTANASKIFNVIPQDVGRPFSHISHHLTMVDLEGMVNQVNESGEKQAAEVFLRNQDWYQLIVRPYLISGRTQSGVVIVLNEINDLKQVQALLSRATERFELAQKGARIGTWVWTIGTDELYWSETIAPMFGIDSSDFHPTLELFMEWVHPQDRDMVHNAMQAALNEDVPFEIEHRIIRRDNNALCWVAESGVVTRDSSGVATRMYGIIREISDRKNAEDRLKVSEEQFRMIFEHAPLGIALLSSNGRPIRSNAALQHTLGYSHDELAGMTIGDLFRSDNSEGDLQAFVEMVQGNRDLHMFERQLATRTGGVAWGRVVLSSVRAGAGRPVESVIMILENVTTAITEERRLGLLKAAVEFGPDPMFLIDRQSRFQDVNRAACAMLGYNREELLTRGVADVTENDAFTGAAWESHWAELAEKGALRYATTHVEKTGESFPVEVVANYLVVGEEAFNCAFVRPKNPR